MRSHACHVDGTRYMTFEEAELRIPDLASTSSVRAAARAAWKRLVSDLAALRVAPVAGEPTTSAFDIWRDGRPRGDGSDGDAAVGERVALDALLERLRAGDAAAASEWADAYRGLAQGRQPRAATSREMPAASVDERRGPHTRYYMPAQSGAREEVVRGRPAPSPSSSDRERLAQYQRQMWRVAPDGQSISCPLGSTLGTASVVVQLFARALEVALRVHASRLAKKKAARDEQVAKFRRQHRDGPLPPPPPLTKEELSWDGGPGFNVQLANATMCELLDVEQRQGYPFTDAAVGDGSWQPRDGTVSRAALLHSGTVVGGALATDDLVGGSRNNYDGEMTHRIDVLSTLASSRLLYIFDSTSPVEAGEHFRRATTSARAKMECDEWLGSTMGFEQRQEVIVYWWSKSHRGHLPEAAADALANGFLSQEEPVPVPHLPSRHVSARGYAKSSERELMLAAYNLFIVREHFKRGDAVRASADDVDALRPAKLNELHGLRVLRLRDDHARLMRSRAFPSGKPESVGAQLSATRCPCGQGLQDRAHLLWHCQLPRVARIRHERLLPACAELCQRLAGCEPVAGTHAVARACCVALEERRAPRSAGVLAVGGVGAVLSDCQTAAAAERHVLGVVIRPYSAVGLARALRAAQPMLIAVSDMLQACERASAMVVQRVFAQHRIGQCLRASLFCLRRAAFEERVDVQSLEPVPSATGRRGTPRIRANTMAPSTQVAMVTTPWQFGGAVIQRALQSDDPMVQVPRVIQQMRRVARAAEVRAASELEAARVCVEVLPTDGEIRRGYPLPSPPARLDVELRVPPLAQLRVLAARRKPDALEAGACMSGGGDPLYWERRQRAMACVQAQHKLSCVRRVADAADDFVSWYEADFAARAAAAVRAQRRRARVAARVAAERARSTPLTSVARLAAKRRAEQHADEAAAVRRRLWPGGDWQSALDAAAAAVVRARRLVEGARRGAPLGGRLGGEGGGGDVTR